MTVEIANPAEPVIVTDAARRHFHEQSERGEGAAIFLKLKESGCTGYMYVLDMVQAQPPGSMGMPLDEAVTLYLDESSVPMMRGTVIDYVRNGLNSELQFHNPNAQEYCGCGESFSIETGSS